MKAILPAAIVVLSTNALAQTTYSFTDATGGAQNWTDPTNWSGGSVPDPVADDTIQTFLTMVSNTTLNLEADRTIGNWSANFGGFGGKTFFIDSGFTLTLAGTSPTLSSANGSLVFNNIIAGTDGLTKTGGATLVLNNSSNSFSGGVDMAGGVLEIASDGVLGDASNDITVSGNSTLSFLTGMTIARNINLNSGTTLRFSQKNSSTISGAITGAGGINMNPSGFGTQSITLSSTSNTFTGNIKVGNDSAANLTVNSLADSTTGNLELRLSNKGNTSFIYGTGATSALVLNDRQVILSGNNTKNHVINNANTNASNTITINKDLSVTSTTNRKLILDGVNTGANSIGGAISDGASGGITALEKAGAGNWVLAGTNTYTGDTTVTAGTLTLSSTGQFRMSIGSNGINNSILGGGNLILDGELMFDLTSAGITLNDTWEIIDVGSLNESYSGTFAVSSTLGSFTEDAGGDLWTISENGISYQFAESTGFLTALAPIPEPSAALICLTGLGLLLRRRRPRS